MFDDFKEFNPLVKCKERTYHRILEEMNIGFAKLREKECEECHAFSNHTQNKENSSTDNEEGTMAYTPPDLLSAVDLWAETLLNDSEIDLKDTCNICNKWKLHATHAKISREEYRWDVQRNNNDWAIYFSCDMEKVIMLPRFPGMKKIIYTKRIILFHKTLAPLEAEKTNEVVSYGMKE